ncbi:MAG TPA: hypothetical protein PKL53_04225 [Methylotenera sp.]|nr:hypothetical protein [Methylotenera sp.]HPV45547.1 hypothetical protein [Methylotenera sp.]
MKLKKQSTIAVALFTCALPTVTWADAVPTQYWMDIHTSNMSMSGMDDGMAGLMGSMMRGGAGSDNTFGNATNDGVSAGGAGKWMDNALRVSKVPAGSKGTHGLPSGMLMGASIPLVPVESGKVEPGNSEYTDPKMQETGKIYFYWGCSDKVRSGQPRVIDFSSKSGFGKFLAGNYTADRGARAIVGNSIWPNIQDKKRVPDNASLMGEHVISGDGVPEGMKFNVDSGYDFMPKIEAKATGETSGSVNVAWNNVNNAKAYFLNAMGSKSKGDMIIWSASEKQEPGWGLMNYLTPKMIEKLLKEKLILPNSQQSCAIPEGIFKETQGVMAQMIAYGPELNVVYPTPDPKKKIKPEWASRLRVKSTTMVMLGGMGGGNSRGNQGQEDSGNMSDSTSKPGSSDTGGSVLDKAKKLKDVFGF